jgi:prefoldin subunit 5
MQLLIDNVSDSEKQGYLLDFIASGYQLPSELPEVVKSLRTDIMELMAARANDQKEIEKLQGENTRLIQQINRL